MSVTAVPIRPLSRGSVLKLWLGLLVLVLLVVIPGSPLILYPVMWVLMPADRPLLVQAPVPPAAT